MLERRGVSQNIVVTDPIGHTQVARAYVGVVKRWLEDQAPVPQSAGNKYSIINFLLADPPESSQRPYQRIRR